MQKKRATKPARLGIQSVEIASRILAAMAAAAQPLQLKDLARRCEMPAAKVHRYLVSLTRANLVAQDRSEGRYGIGPAAISLGLAGLRSVDVVQVASESLIELRDATGETAVLAVWSTSGPVIIRIEESSRPVFMNVRVGSTLPILRSAVGRIFAAFLPKEDITRLIEKDRRLLARVGGPGLDRSVYDILRKTRQDGIGVVDGVLVPGVTAIAAPVFDHRGRIVASLALLGSPENLAATMSDLAARLKKTGMSISQRLGFSQSLPPSDPPGSD